MRRATARARRRARTWMTIVSCLVGAVTAGACAAGGWMLLHEEPMPPQQNHTEDETVPRDDGPDPILSRETDPDPVTLAEFVTDDTLAGYRVLDGEELDDCADAVTDGLVEALEKAGCSQVVRTTVLSADEQYVATVGVANLADADAAEALHARITDGVDGGFAALRADGPAGTLGLTPTVLGFTTHGHYLLYVVIGRSDGESPPRDDPAVTAMVADLVDEHLPKALAPRSR